MPRKAPDCRSNLSIADKRKVLKIYEERAVGVGQRKVAKMASEQLGRPISHVTVHNILKKKDLILGRKILKEQVLRN